MQRQQTQVLQWARRVRDFLVEHAIKSLFAELSALKQQLDEVVEQLTANAAAQEAVTKESRVQTTEIKRLRQTLRDEQMKPVVKLSRTMTLQINGSDITFVLPAANVEVERLAAAGDAMVTALKVVGQQFVARGMASDFVEQLSNTTKALRAAIDERAAQVSRRTGTTAALTRDRVRLTQLVQVIDSLVRPVIQTDPELLAAWDNVVALPPRSKSGGVVVATPPVAPTTPAPAPAAA